MFCFSRQTKGKPQFVGGALKDSNTPMFSLHPDMMFLGNLFPKGLVDMDPGRILMVRSEKNLTHKCLGVQSLGLCIRAHTMPRKSTIFLPRKARAINSICSDMCELPYSIHTQRVQVPCKEVLRPLFYHPKAILMNSLGIA